MRVNCQRNLATGRRSEDGFLLLEVLVAVFLLGISVFVLIEGLSRCVAAARSVQNYTVSDILLANKSYEFRTERPADIDDQRGAFDDYPGYSWTRKFEATDIEGLWADDHGVLERARQRGRRLGRGVPLSAG